MTKLSCVKVLFCWGCFLITCFAQTNTPTVNQRISREDESRLGQTNKSADDSTPPTVFTKRGALSFRKKLTREQKKLLTPDAADSSSYAAFLQSPNTGLIKLFPDIGCEDNANIVRADADCLKSIPMSAFYSFREEKHTTDFLSDIRLKDNVLITDGLLSQGILAALGDIALENITLSSGGMNFLAEYKPEPQSGEALKQTLQLIKGIKSGGYFYRKALPAKENMTYALRVIAYRGSIVQTFRGVPFNMLEGDERTDIIVVFRVLRKNEAGSFTLLWKELSRKAAPKVVFPKKVKGTVSK